MPTPDSNQPAGNSQPSPGEFQTREPLRLSLKHAASWEGVEDSYWGEPESLLEESEPIVPAERSTPQSLDLDANTFEPSAMSGAAESVIEAIDLSARPANDSMADQDSVDSGTAHGSTTTALDELVAMPAMPCRESESPSDRKRPSEQLQSIASSDVGGWSLLQLLGSSKGVDVWTAQPQSAFSHDQIRYVLKQAREDSTVGRKLIRQEVAVLSSVRSRSIVPLLDFNVTSPAPFLVVPQLPTPIETHKLSQPLRRNQLARVLCVARQTARALSELHEHGWIHGDLAPRHISIDDALHVTLFDLSLARAIHGGAQAERDAWTGCVTGSLETLAPEGFDSSAPVLAERDCYALGVTLAWWLAGAPPWLATTSKTWEQLHRTQPPDLDRLHRAGFPIELQALLEQMLAKQPLRRPTMEEVERRLLDLEIDHFGLWCQSDAA